MKALFTFLVVVVFLFGSAPSIKAQDELPTDAQAVVLKAAAKLNAAKQAYDDACTKIRAQEVKDLLHVYEGLKSRAPTLAAAVKATVDNLTAMGKGVSVAASCASWVLGKWVVSNNASYKAIWEFKKDNSVSQGDLKGKWSVVEGEDNVAVVQIVWTNQVVETMKMTEGDSGSVMGRAGAMTATRTTK